jgi:hypothetical protein
MRYLVQVLLPLYDNDGHRFDEAQFADVRRDLTGRFGGVTAYIRSPATGLWKRDDGTVDRDEMLMFEVMVEALDPDWWAGYRESLERRFKQESIVARAVAIQAL